MPYIKTERRAEIDVNDASAKVAGELNYRLTKEIQRYWVNSARNYQAINDIIGALEGAKAEFQRRIVVPYEDNKIQENGDVY